MLPLLVVGGTELVLEVDTTDSEEVCDVALIMSEAEDELCEVMTLAELPSVCPKEDSWLETVTTLLEERGADAVEVLAKIDVVGRTEVVDVIETLGPSVVVSKVAEFWLIVDAKDNDAGDGIVVADIV